MPNHPIPAAATGLPDEKSLSYFELREHAAAKRFDKIYADWLAAKAAHSAGCDDDDENDRLSDAEDEAARLLLITPAVRNYHVWQKIEEFEFYFCGDGKCEWTDEREVAFFGCIKADLAHLGIGGSDV